MELGKHDLLFVILLFITHPFKELVTQSEAEIV